jgi:hypothetical protein
LRTLFSVADVDPRGQNRDAPLPTLKHFDSDFAHPTGRVKISASCPRLPSHSNPLLAPTLLYAWLWIALLVFRELTLAVILSTADNITFPVVVWSLWLGGGLGQASALAVVMLVIMTPMIALYWIFARRQGLVAT